jgi:hypothetical protein
MTDSDPLGGIELKEPTGYGEKLLDAVPFAGDAVSLFTGGRTPSRTAP